MSVVAIKSRPSLILGLFASFAEIFATFGAAAAVSDAVSNRRRPADADLRQLGIDPKTFNVRM